jgi:hypothetical protein
MNLTVQELADKANLPATLISGLQSSNRHIGENNARRLGLALNLSGRELDTFVYEAINRCSEKLLEDSKKYPAEIINLAAKHLQQLGINGEQVTRCVLKPKLKDGSEPDAVVFLNDGRTAFLELKISTR